MNNILVELHVDDFEKAKKYYGELGFEIVWERKPEGKKGYLVMKMEDNIFCFWGGNSEIYDQEYFKNFSRDTKRGYGVEIVIQVNEIDKYYKRVKSTANIVEELTVQPWDLKDFRIEDPFGYYIRITSKHDILDDKYAVK